MKIRQRLNLYVPLAASLCLLLFVQRAHAQEIRQLKAGASVINVTPFLGEVLIGGFGSPVAKYIHDELYARSLVLDDGETQIAIVIVDNLHFVRGVSDAARLLVEQHTGIKKENVLIAATHTHSSVSAIAIGSDPASFDSSAELDEYQRFLARRIADGVRRAAYNKVSAKIGWGSVQKPEHVFNRRWFMKPNADLKNPFGGKDKVKMNPGIGNPDLDRPAGPTDPEVFFLSVQSLDGHPISLLANYSLHYVGGVPGDHVSADYFGVFSSHLQELIGEDRKASGFVAMLSNGTSGNINNIDFRRPAPKMSSYQKMQIVAKDVAETVFEAYRNIPYQTYVKLGATYTELPLQVRQSTPEMLTRAKKVVSDPNTKLLHPLEPAYANRMIWIDEKWPKKVDAVMQAFQIGDLAVVGIPFETFVETGLEIKAKSPYQSTFTISLANGWYGYLPTPEHHELGGYET
jgi:neutral ceramidase